MRRLDDVIGHADAIKLDLQGYELPALRGAQGVLDSTDAILTEFSFVELYEGQERFSEIDHYLNKQGFELFNLYDLHTQKTGQLERGDALYRRVDAQR